MADTDASQPSTAVGASPHIQPSQEPRLMIAKIVCENFKSYAGVKELGPFHKVGGGRIFILGARFYSTRITFLYITSNHTVFGNGQCYTV